MKRERVAFAVALLCLVVGLANLAAALVVDGTMTTSAKLALAGLGGVVLALLAAIAGT